MKNYLIILTFCLLQLSINAQDLLNIYKTGKVKLVPDKEFGQANDWNRIFRSYYDTIYDKPMGERKSLVVLPDGSVIVNHAYREYVTKFLSNGKFEKELVVEKAKHKPILGSLNGNMLFTGLDNMGNMTISDLNGKFVKTLKLDYMAHDIIALGKDKLAVSGWVIHSDKFRSFVSIVDINTNIEKVIWDESIERPACGNEKSKGKRQPFNYSVTLNDGSVISTSTMPYSSFTGKGIPPQITSVNNELILAIPNTGEIFVYDVNGKQKLSQSINWANSFISVEEQKTIQKQAIERYKAFVQSGNERVKGNLEAYQQVIKDMESDLQGINVPIAKPSFANIIKDSDENVLFFEIPEERNANVFHVWVHDNGGNFLAKCTFVCDDYELNISAAKMAFYKGYLYALQTIKGKEGNPLRLVRFKLATN